MAIPLQMEHVLFQKQLVAALWRAEQVLFRESHTFKAHIKGVDLESESQ